MAVRGVAFLISAFIAFMAADFSACELPAGRRIWCYYTNWAQYRPVDVKYTVSDVDPNLCTHFSYAFAVIRNNLVVPYEYNDDNSTFNIGMYYWFNQLRVSNPKLKTFLAVGGWNFGSLTFSQMACSPESRRTFIDSAVKFLRDRNFDGLDFDWEYPANRRGIKEDKINFAKLIKELYEAFVEDGVRRNKPRLMLAIAVGAAKHVVDSAYNVPEINRFVDFINIMSYDYHGSWENNTAHSSPLFSGKDEKGDSRYWNTAWSTLYWLEMGASADKINVGVPLYGRSFTLYDPQKNGVGAYAPLPGKKGEVTRTDGFLSYFELCQKLMTNGKRVYIPEQKVPYMVKEDQWVGYEDQESVATKVEWLLQKKLSGIMIWAIDMDDYKGVCGRGKYPLMKAINRAMNKQIPPTEPGVLHTTTTVNPETGFDLKNEFCKSRPFGVYASNVSCHHFVFCMNGNYFLNECPRNMVWSSLVRNCRSPGNGDC